jgi:hypothetical protein
MGLPQRLLPFDTLLDTPDESTPIRLISLAESRLLSPIKDGGRAGIARAAAVDGLTWRHTHTASTPSLRPQQYWGAKSKRAADISPSYCKRLLLLRRAHGLIYPGAKHQPVPANQPLENTVLKIRPTTWSRGRLSWPGAHTHTHTHTRTGPTSSPNGPLVGRGCGIDHLQPRKLGMHSSPYTPLIAVLCQSASWAPSIIPLETDDLPFLSHWWLAYEQRMPMARWRFLHSRLGSSLVQPKPSWPLE